MSSFCLISSTTDMMQCARQNTQGVINKFTLVLRLVHCALIRDIAIRTRVCQTTMRNGEAIRNRGNKNAKRACARWILYRTRRKKNGAHCTRCAPFDTPRRARSLTRLWRNDKEAIRNRGNKNAKRACARWILYRTRRKRTARIVQDARRLIHRVGRVL